jgi:hypothetical protein
MSVYMFFPWQYSPHKTTNFPIERRKACNSCPEKSVLSLAAASPAYLINWLELIRIDWIGGGIYVVYTYLKLGQTQTSGLHEYAPESRPRPIRPRFLLYPSTHHYRAVNSTPIRETLLARKPRHFTRKARPRLRPQAHGLLRCANSLPNLRFVFLYKYSPSSQWRFDGLFSTRGNGIIGDKMG